MGMKDVHQESSWTTSQHLEKFQNRFYTQKLAIRTTFCHLEV